MQTRSLIAAAILLGVGGTAAAESKTATADLVSPKGESRGSVTLTETPHGVLVEAELEGLPEGEHGFHIHETGACEPDFSAAGDHFAPDDRGHGLNAEDGYHAGDLPNIFVGEDGTARADFFTVRVSLGGNDQPSLMDEDGSSIIVHEDADSYGDEASAGGRIACGAITEG